MRLRITLFSLLMAIACGPTPDPCDDERESFPLCEPTGGEWEPIDDQDCVCKCPDGLDWDKGHGCQPTTTTTTTSTIPDEPKPEDYKHINLTRAEAQWLESNDGLVGHIWGCVRNPLYAVSNCPDCLEYMDLTPADLREFIDKADETNAAIASWLPRLKEVNRRCEDADSESFMSSELVEIQSDDPWCSHSNIKKTVWNAEYKPLRNQMDLEFDTVAAWLLVAETNWGRAFDGFKHWCLLIERGQMPCKPELQ